MDEKNSEISVTSKLNVAKEQVKEYVKYLEADLNQ